MFATIVVGTDGSKDANRAVSTAGELAAANGGRTEVHVVTAHHPLSLSELRQISRDLPEEFHPLLHSHMGAEATMSEAKRLLQAAGVEATFHEIDDHPTDAIIEVAERQQADLIVVGSRGEGLARRVLHGSVSTGVFHQAPCAVLMVKADD